MDHASPRPEYDADGPCADDGGGDGQPPLTRGLLLALALIGAIGFAALGTWQIERRAWKLDLIATVDARVHAPPQPFVGQQAPYTRVSTTGRFDHRAETLVQAVTERGAGHWLLTPLHGANGIVLIDRGFVPDDPAAPIYRPTGQVTITGLLRTTEPGGGFLRHNDPAHDRWYSRDVTAIAHARHLGRVAPVFIDADATPNPGGLPVGGLTVIRFRNAHLVYALTWFALTALCLAAIVLLLRTPRA